MWAADAPPRLHPKVRIDLTQFMREPEGVRSTKHHSIDSLSFSNDGKRLALAAMGHVRGYQGLLHIVVVDWDKPRPTAVTLGSSADSTVWSPGRTLQWSSDDRFLLLDQDKPVLLDAETGAPRCEPDPTESRVAVASGFAGAGRFFMAYRIAGVGGGTMVTFHDFDCHPAGDHKLGERLMGTSAFSSDRIALRSDDGFVLLRGPDWKEKKITDDRPGAVGVFLSHGRTLCAADLSKTGNVSVVCWSIGDGDVKPLRKYDSPSNCTLPISGAANAPRVAFLEGTINERAQWVRFGHYVVWDPGTGATITSLPAEIQRVEMGGSKADAPFVTALSPDGSLLALAGQNVVEIYALPPAK